MSRISQMIDRLQGKPEQERRKILWFSTSALFGIIFLAWFASFGVSWSLYEDNSTYEKVAPFASVSHLFEVVTEDVTRGVEILSEKADEAFGEGGN